MKKLITILALATLIVGCGAEKKNNKNIDPESNPAEKIGLASFDQDVELTIRNRAGEPDNYVTSTFSFFHLTRDDVDKTHNGWDIQASPIDGGSFTTVMVVGDLGRIVDLGKMSCQEIQNDYEQGGAYPGIGAGGYPHKRHRKTDPSFWFRYSKAMDDLQDSNSNVAKIQLGHCYAVSKISSDTKVVAVFRVKAFEPDVMVVLDEIEVFEKAKIEELR